MTVPRKLAQVRAELKPLGITVCKPDDAGEYRVNYTRAFKVSGRWWGRESTAYYTADLDDALGAGKHMAEQRVAALAPRAR